MRTLSKMLLMGTIIAIVVVSGCTSCVTLHDKDRWCKLNEFDGVYDAHRNIGETAINSPYRIEGCYKIDGNMVKYRRIIIDGCNIYVSESDEL